MNNSYPNPYNLHPARRTADANPSFASAALTCGILSIILSITMFLPFIFGGMGIFLAIMSRGRDCRFSSRSKAAIVCSVIGIAIVVFLFFFAFLYISSHYGWEHFMNELMREMQNMQNAS